MYDDYSRSVPRFLPSFSGLGETIRGMRFDWRRLLRKEYGATFAWISTALALAVWEIWVRQGPRAGRARLRMAVLAWAPVVAAYLTARWLKKRRYLASGS